MDQLCEGCNFWSKKDVKNLNIYLKPAMFKASEKYKLKYFGEMGKSSFLFFFVMIFHLHFRISWKLAVPGRRHRRLVTNSFAWSKTANETLYSKGLKRMISYRMELLHCQFSSVENPKKHLRLWQKECLTKSKQTYFSWGIIAHGY